MAESTTRVRAGQTVNITFTPETTSGTFEAKAIDALGRLMRCSTSVNAPNVTVTISAGEWKDGRPGLGRVELKQTDGSTISFPATAKLRILPGLDVWDSDMHAPGAGSGSGGYDSGFGSGFSNGFGS